MGKETRTSFVNRVMGLSLGSIQGKYSYCNDERKLVLFSLNLSHGEDSHLILSPKWSHNNYIHSLKHIDKIRDDGYELFIFKTKTRKNKSGKTVTVGFETSIEKRKLVIDGEDFKAVPFGSSYKSVDETFRDEVIKASNSPIEERRKRLRLANSKPKQRIISVAVYDRNPDVVAEVLFRANGKCEKCQEFAPFNRVSDGTPYLEVHHIEQLAKGGDDKVENAIALCPNCHRKAHYG